MFYAHSDPIREQFVSHGELRNYDMWLKCIKLLVNFKRTNYVIFNQRQRIANHDFNNFFGIQLLNQTKETKFLEFYLNDHFTWKFCIEANRKIRWYYI